MPRFIVFMATALLLLPLRTSEAAEGAVSFSHDIAPILLEQCLACHGPERAKGKYRVDTFEALLRPGSSDQAPILAGEPRGSELFRRLTAEHEDDRMPRDAEPLSSGAIELFRRWIAEGANLDKGETDTALSALALRKPHPAPPLELPNPVPVLALAFNSAGTELAISGYHQVLICDLAGKLPRRITNVTQRVHALGFHPDGKSLIVVGGQPGRGGEASIYDLGSGELRATPVRSSDEQLCLAISPDGNTVAVGGTDHTIHLIEWETATVIRTIQQHADWVTALQFSGDGKRLASASRDRTARVYDSASGELITTYVNHTGPVHAVAFLDDERVASGGREGSVHFWKIEDGKKDGGIERVKSEILGILRDGETIYALGGREVVARKIEDRSLARRYSRGPTNLFALALHSPSQTLATGAFDGSVSIWSCETGEVKSVFHPGSLKPGADR